MSLADLIKDLPTTPMVERKHNPLIIPEIKMYIASIGGKEEFHKIVDTKKYAAEFLGFCAEFMANGGEANEIMIKSCDLIDTWFCENRPSIKHYTDHGITHFSDESHKWLFDSDLYLAFIEVVQTEDYVKQLSFYWSDTMYAVYGKLN